MLSDLGLGSLPDILVRTWDESARERPSPEASPFAPAKLRDACSRIGLLPGTTEACLADAAAVSSSPALSAFAWHAWWVIFRSGLDVRPSVADWPQPGELQGCVAPRLPPFFWAVVLLGGTDLVFGLNAARGIAEEVTAATLRDLDLWIHECRLRTGRPGFLELCWLVYHFTGRVFALGRLQFDARTNDVGFHLFARSGASGAPGHVALADEGMRFRPNGQFADADRLAVANPWKATFSASGGAIEGHAVSPDGSVAREKTLLDPRGWSRIASPGSPVLGVHIPASGPFHGPLAPGECDEAFARASAFFGVHFPGHGFRAFTCKSWILDSQLARYLPADSNIMRFQRRFILVPVEGANDAQAIERVFAIPVARTADWSWETAPADSGMRRILVEHVRSGGRWRMGGGIIPAVGIPAVRD